MHQLLLHSEERGKVAAGYAFQNAGRTTYHKDAVSGGHLPLKHFERGARTGIVHTRNATFGAPENNDNNHPVLDPTKRIVLIHNGVIHNHDSIREGLKDETFAPVDSSVLPTLIREFGVDGLAETTGWASLAWYDTKTFGVLHLARVQGAAPLMVIGLEDGSIVFGSTFLIVHAALIECGFGDQIAWGFDLAEHTYIQVKAGQIVHMQNLRKYEAAKARFKPAKALSWQEQKKLEAITNGTDQTAATPTTVNPVTTTSPYPPKQTVGTAYPQQMGTAPYRPQPQHQNWNAGRAKINPPSKFVPPSTDLVPLEDPLARINKAFADAPKTATGTITSIPLTPVPYNSGYRAPLSQSSRKRTFPDDVESYLIYWYCFHGENVADLKEDSFDYHADYDEFVEWVTQLDREGQLTDWGIVGVNGEILSTKHLTTRDAEEDFILAQVAGMVKAEGGNLAMALDDEDAPGDALLDAFRSPHTASEDFDTVNSYLERYGDWA